MSQFEKVPEDEAADIAEVTDGFEEAGFFGEFNRQPSIDIEIYRIGDQSPLEIAEKVHGVLEDAATAFPPGMQYRIVSSDELPETVSSSDLSNLSLGIGVRVGVFPQYTDQ